MKCSAALEHACVNGRSLQTLPADVPADVPVDAAHFPFTWCQKKKKCQNASRNTRV